MTHEELLEDLEDMQTDPNALIDSSLEQNPEVVVNTLVERNKNRTLAQKAPSPWKLSEKGKAAVSNGVALFRTKYGLFSAIPMLCKGEECPYAMLYPHMHEGSVEDGERCPVEVAFIMSKYDQYMTEFDIQETDAVDMSLLRDLVDFDVQILRADNQIALEGGFSAETVVAVDTEGRPISREEISVAANYKDKIQAKRNKTLEMFNSTRKDKAGMKITTNYDPSTYAQHILAQLDENSSVEADFEELDVIEDVPYMEELNKSKQRDKEKHQAKINYVPTEDEEEWH